MESNKRYLIVGTVVIMIVAMVGVTYAYWRGQIKGEGSNMSVTLDKVYIQFTDSTEIAETGVRPGWSTSKTFTVENQGSTDFKYDIYIKDLINTLVTEGYFQYKITSNNNGYNMEDYVPIAKSPEASDFDLGTEITIGAGVTQIYTIEFRYVNDPDVDQSEDMGKRFGGQLMIRENTGVNLYTLLSDGVKYMVSTKSSFSSPEGGTSIVLDNSNEKGKIYKIDDNNYYFAGNPSDNWVLFAGKYWRIIRTEKGIGTKLLYAGTSHDGQDGYIGSSVWNNNYSDYQYAYWYDTSNSSYRSSIKSILDSWYSSNIGNNTSNDNMVESIVYCNDASYNSGYFGAYKRLKDSKSPNHSCGTNNFGAAAKVGMMTADEVAYAGGVYDKDAPNTYYYRNAKTSECTGSSGDPCSVTADNHWWTLSPFNFDSTYARVNLVHGASGFPGRLSCGSVNSSYAVRPVITLKSEVLVTGNGTTDSPYEPYL